MEGKEKLQKTSIVCTMLAMQNDKGIAPSEAARALGSIRTAKKAASSSANLKRAHIERQAQRRRLAEIPCTCSGGDSTNRRDHVGTCARYHAIRYRENRGLPLE